MARTVHNQRKGFDKLEIFAKDKALIINVSKTKLMKIDEWSDTWQKKIKYREENDYNLKNV